MCRVSEEEAGRGWIVVTLLVETDSEVVRLVFVVVGLNETFVIFVFPSVVKSNCIVVVSCSEKAVVVFNSPIVVNGNSFVGEVVDRGSVGAVSWEVVLE